jgi:large subunit ribosomal protein L21
MYAIIKTGGKQYRVQEGQTVKVESLGGDVGSELTFRNGDGNGDGNGGKSSGEILALGTGADLTLGAALGAAASVAATVVSHGRHAKVRIFKMRRRKHYQKRQGHRQNYTEIRIGALSTGA